MTVEIEGPNSSWPSTAFQRELESRYPAGTLAPGVKTLRKEGYLAQSKQGHVLIQRGPIKVAMVLTDRRRKIYGYRSL